jgi:hypothetical protein
MDCHATGQVRAPLFPHDDLAFETDVQEAIASSWETIQSAERLLADVRAKLRTDYPNVRLMTQARLAADPLGPDVIYAYRDGRVA